MPTENHAMLENPKVLVVDDEEVIRELLLQFLSEHACQVVVSDTPTKALGLLSEHVFDVALIDYTLPGMDGLELCRRIVKECPATRCVLITGWGDLEQAEREGTVSKVVAKPFDLNAMLELVKELAGA